VPNLWMSISPQGEIETLLRLIYFQRRNQPKPKLEVNAMLTKIFTADAVQSHLKALLAVLFALQPQQRKPIVPVVVRVRTAMPARNAHDIINKEL
jgi:hypothetical protein